jgi:hypothetical protein
MCARSSCPNVNDNGKACGELMQYQPCVDFANNLITQKGEPGLFLETTCYDAPAEHQEVRSVPRAASSKKGQRL